MTTKSQLARRRKHRRRAEQKRPATASGAGRHASPSGRTGSVEHKHMKTLVDRAERMGEREASEPRKRPKKKRAKRRVDPYDLVDKAIADMQRRVIELHAQITGRAPKRGSHMQQWAELVRELRDDK